MNNSQFSISIHILTLLARANGELLSSDYLAGSININPVLVRKELMNLKKHQLVASKEGKGGGSYLNKPAGEILLSDVYHAVKHPTVLGLSKNKPNPKCIVGKQITKHLEVLYSHAEKAMIQPFEKITLKKFIATFS